MEVVSGGREDRRRDLVVKRAEYAAAGIAEYWIVDPDEKVILVLRLESGQYVEHGRFTDGKAFSAALSGFAVSIADVWAAALG
jgi:Uma2 family endonuclease